MDKMILTGNYDEKELPNIITKMNRVKYKLFLEEIINLKKENHLKEYYLKVSAILRMKHDGSFVTAIKVPGEDLPLFDSKKVNGALAQHCRKNFDDKGWKQTHNPGNIEAITTHQLHQAALKVRNKAISTDLIPDTILNHLNEELTISLTKILNDMGHIFLKPATGGRIAIHEPPKIYVCTMSEPMGINALEIAGFRKT